MANLLKKAEVQGRWILSQGWLNRQQIAKAYTDCLQGQHEDLCVVLAQYGWLTLDQVELVRQAVAPMLTNRTPVQEAIPIHAMPTAVQQGPAVERTLVLGQTPPQHDVEATTLQRSGEIDQTVIQQPGLTQSQERPLLNSLEQSGVINTGQQLPGSLGQRYEVLSELNRGAMGVVYKAEERSSGRVVALKFMLQQNPDERELARFRLEAEVMVRLKHPHIIEITDFGEEAGHLYIAMEFVEGADVRELVLDCMRKESTPPPWPEMVGHLLNIAEALSYCHEREILHRDVKPQNILMSNEGRALLADFGLLKKAKDEGESDTGQNNLTRTGEMVGTPAYMAPEQFMPGGAYGDVGPKAEVFAWSATLFFTLTGEIPFNKPTPYEIFTAMTSGSTPSPRKLRPDIPEWLDELCGEGLSTRQEDRPSMAEIVATLNDELAKQHATPIWPIALVGALCLLLPIAILVPLLTPSAPAQFKTLKASSKLTAENAVVIEGRATQGDISVSVGETLVKTDEHGFFKVEQALTEGFNEISVTLEPKRKGGAVQQLTIERDSTAPKIALSLKQNDAGEYLLEDVEQLRGVLRDRHPSHVDGPTGRTPTDRSGLFQMSILDSVEASHLILVGHDTVGNQCRAEFTVLTPKALARRRDRERQRNLAKQRQHEQRLALAKQRKLQESRNQKLRELFGRELFSDKEWLVMRPLFDQALWQDCSKVDQDMVFERAAKRFQGQFQFLSSKVFQCGALRSSVGVFKHKGTGLVFHLIPGGFHKDFLLLNESLRSTAMTLRQLADPGCSRRAIQASFKDFEPFDDFRRWTCKLLGVDYDQIKKSIRKKVDHHKEHEKYETMRAKEICAQVFKNEQSLARFRKQLLRTAEYYENLNRVDFEDYVGPMFVAEREVNQKTWFATHGSKSVNVQRDSWADFKPVHGVKYNQAEKWARKNELRLPTRLEWTHLAAAGSTHNYFWGPDTKQSDRYCWSLSQVWVVQASVKHEQLRNAFGLIDTLGNCGEWADPDWQAWAKRWRKLGNAGQIKGLETYLSEQSGRAPIMGGSAWWHPEFCTVTGHYMQSQSQNWGLWGLRPVLSFP